LGFFVEKEVKMKIEGIKAVEILHKLIELKPAARSGDPDDHPEPVSVASVSIDSETDVKELELHISRLIRHPLFERYQLQYRDVMVIAELWQQHLEHVGRGSAWSEICAGASINRNKVSECLAYITGLVERNIICFDERISGDYYLNPVILQSAEYTLSKDLILRILGRDLRADLTLVLKEEWQSDDDFMSDLRLILDICYNSFAELGSRAPAPEYPILSTCLELLRQRIHSAPDTLGIKLLMLRHQLNEHQLDIIMLAVYHQLCREDRILEADAILSLAPDPRLRRTLQELLSDESALLSEGLLYVELRHHRAQFATLGVPQEILGTLGIKSKADPETKHIKVKSPFTKSRVGQSLKDLILPEADIKLLSAIIDKCRTDKQNELMSWGFGTHLTGSKQGMVLLLYGAPGTGKTFTAGVIANELDGDLVMLNVPELRNKYYGDTEKIIKKAFTEMREMAVQQNPAPVFLLNEADQLIHNRIEHNSTCGTIENNIQSIILEELETFPGILILTTNLERNMDEAFFRRFDLKFKFNMPDLECRRKLWKLYLRKEIPGAQDIDIEHLAEHYYFSGAQIAMVVHNACIEAVNRTGNLKRLLLTDIINYSNLEKPWTKGPGKSIGF